MNSKMIKKNLKWAVLAIIVSGALGAWYVNRQTTLIEDLSSREIQGFKTNTDKKSILLEKLLSGGPGKDGIPAIRDPKFTSINQSGFGNDVLGVLINLNGEQRYYPYNILVWHEVVNDSIKNNKFAVTFCPLCGSAIVFDRNINGDSLEFGVSGLLYESNLVMYDDRTESLWSQAKSEAIVGEYTGTKLDILPFQVITLEEVKKKYPNSKVLSKNTGHNRDYSFNPYGKYDTTEEIYFPVSKKDTRYSAKAIMYIVPFDGKSIAFEQIKLRDGQSSRYEIEGKTLTAKRVGEELLVTDSNGKNLPGYYEMWFSWVIHHEKDGIVWKIE